MIINWRAVQGRPLFFSLTCCTFPLKIEHICEENPRSTEQALPSNSCPNLRIRFGFSRAPQVDGLWIRSIYYGTGSGKKD